MERVFLVKKDGQKQAQIITRSEEKEWSLEDDEVQETMLYIGKKDLLCTAGPVASASQRSKSALVCMCRLQSWLRYFTVGQWGTFHFKSLL